MRSPASHTRHRSSFPRRDSPRPSDERMRAAITAGLVVLSAPSAAFVPSTSVSHRASTADSYLGARPTTPSAVVADHDAARGTRRRSAVQLFASGLASDGDANVMTVG